MTPEPINDNPSAARRVAARRVLLTMGTTVSLQLLGVASGALLAHLLGVDKRGLLAAVVLWPSVIAYAGDLGGPVAYTYLASTAPRSVPGLVSNAVYLSVFQAAVLSLLGIPILVLALGKYQGLGLAAVAFLIAYLPLNLLTRYLMGIHQGAGNFLRFNTVRVAVQLTMAIGVGLLFLARIPTVDAVLVVTVIANAVAFMVAGRSLMVRHLSSWHFNRPLAVQTFRYGLKAHVGNLTPVDAIQLDLVLVVALLNVRDVGLYAVAVSAAAVIRGQGIAIGMVVMPGIAALGAATDRLKAIASVFKVAFILHAAMAAFVIVFADILVTRIYGPSFSGAVPIIRVLCVGSVAASLRQVLNDAIRGLGKPLVATFAEVLTVCVALPALLILAPSHGTVGAAFAVSLAYLVALLVQLTYLHHLGLRWAVLLVPGRTEIRLVGLVFRRYHKVEPRKDS